MTITSVAEILRPGEPGYEEARRIWNGTVDRRPAMIARCRTSTEVAAAVRMGRASGLEISVRGGGHSIPGLSVVEGGLMVDLSPMKGLLVDSDRRIARAQPGLLWRDYDAGTEAYGLASPGGEISHTGVAGLTLGGGIGWLGRRYGLAADNLIGVELVTAEGDVIEADDESDPELMWGLRGGGGNFGIVTEFRFRVHPVAPLYAGSFIWPHTEAVEVLGAYNEAVADAPRDLALTTAQVVAPPAPFVPPALQLQPVVVVSAVWTGDPADGPAAVEHLRKLSPAIDTFEVQPYSAIQRWVDEGVPHGRRYHCRSEWLGPLDEAAVTELTSAHHAMPSPFNQILLRHLGGAISDVTADATAFRYRDATHMITIVAGWDEGPDEPHMSWCKATFERIRPWSIGGGYVNHLSADEGADRVRSAYGPATWDRLVALKRRMDPENVFHLNQNVDPS